MRKLARSQGHAVEPIEIVGGARTRGIVHRPGDNDQPGAEFALPKTTLRVLSNSIVKLGDVIKTRAGERYLVANHSRTVDYITYHLFETDRAVSWEREAFNVNPVSKQRQSLGRQPVQAAPIWVMWERARREFMDLNIRIAQETYLLATGEDIQLGDFLDGKLVKRVSNALGIKVVELQG